MIQHDIQVIYIDSLSFSQASNCSPRNKLLGHPLQTLESYQTFHTGLKTRNTRNWSCISKYSFIPVGRLHQALTWGTWFLFVRFWLVVVIFKNMVVSLRKFILRSHLVIWHHQCEGVECYIAHNLGWLLIKSIFFDLTFSTCIFRITEGKVVWVTF